MDWSKAKTILIFALIITNLALGFFWLEDKKELDPTLTEKFSQEVEDMLLSKNIKLDTDLPKKEASLTPIIVEYEEIDYKKLNEKLFSGKGKLSSKGKQMRLDYGNESVKLFNKKTLEYINNSDQSLYSNLNEDLAKEIALGFLSKLEIDLEDLTSPKIYKKEDGYRVSYFKKYHGSYVEKAYIHLDIDEVGVRGLKRLWLDVVDEGDNEIYINSAPKAILSLLSREEFYGKTIDDISLCYYFDPKEHDYLQTPEEARKGKTIPAWRISFSDGSRTIIDDY